MWRVKCITGFSREADIRSLTSGRARLLPRRFRSSDHGPAGASAFRNVPSAVCRLRMRTATRDRADCRRLRRFRKIGQIRRACVGGLSDHPHASNILSWPLGLSAADQDFVEVTDGSVFDGINALFGADQRRGGSTRSAACNASSEHNAMVNAGAIQLECLSARDFCVDGFFEQQLGRDGEFLDCTCIDRHDSAGQCIQHGN